MSNRGSSDSSAFVTERLVWEIRECVHKRILILPMTLAQLIITMKRTMPKAACFQVIGGSAHR